MKSVMRSMLSIIMLMASQNGTIRNSNRMIVMTRTAMLRRLPAWRCTQSMSGHVAITKVNAQMIAARNGNITQIELTRRPPMNNTASVTRVIS